jgi:4-hydroxybenzoate polyprenyltransferase
MLHALISSTRPHQWVKNLFVAAPLLFSKNLLDPRLLFLTLAAFALFSLLSGSVYLVNDLFDIERDRLHPRKCRRPIASGRLPLPTARSAAALLMIVGLGGAMALGLPFFATAASYLLLNLAYSLALKHIPFVDVLSIAGGFLLRVLGGSYAIVVAASPWLLICTFVLACYLGFGKRAHELSVLESQQGESHRRKTRPVLARYSLRQLALLLWLLGAVTCVAYALYTIAPHTRAFFGTGRLVYTIPFAIFGVARFSLLAGRRASAESPTDAMLRDLPFMLNPLGWAVAVVLIIYCL